MNVGTKPLEVTFEKLQCVQTVQTLMGVNDIPESEKTLSVEDLLSEIEARLLAADRPSEFTVVIDATHVLWEESFQENIMDAFDGQSIGGYGPFSVTLQYT